MCNNDSKFNALGCSFSYNILHSYNRVLTTLHWQSMFNSTRSKQREINTFADMIFERYVNEIASIVLNALMIQALLVTTINLSISMLAIHFQRIFLRTQSRTNVM